MDRTRTVVISGRRNENVESILLRVTIFLETGLTALSALVQQRRVRAATGGT